MHKINTIASIFLLIMILTHLDAAETPDQINDDDNKRCCQCLPPLPRIPEIIVHSERARRIALEQLAIDRGQKNSRDFLNRLLKEENENAPPPRMTYLQYFYYILYGRYYVYQ